MNLAVIPARGGSKRIPKKNIKDFCGKPIIAWSIEAAIVSGCFDKIIVSTDNEEIATISKKFGAEVPFIRPKEISDDFTEIKDVIVHAINFFENQMIKFDQICCIYATAPSIRANDIRKGLDSLNSEIVDFSLAVSSFPYPIQRALRISEDYKVSMIYPENYCKRSQDLEESYHDAGQFIWGKRGAWRNSNLIYDKCVSPIIIPRNRVQDIDTMEDWLCLENIFIKLSE